MCGRFQLRLDIQRIMEHYGVENPSVQEYQGGDFYPSGGALMVTHGEKKDINFAKWGFQLGEKKLVINARAESIGEKPMFKETFLHRRCILPANLFYEWKEEMKGKKVKYEIGLQDHDLLSLGGIYRFIKDGNSEGEFRFVIVTTGATREMSSIHSRMPLIIRKDAVDPWLAKDTSLSSVADIIGSNLEHKLLIERSLDDATKKNRGKISEQIKMF